MFISNIMVSCGSMEDDLINKLTLAAVYRQRVTVITSVCLSVCRV